MKIEVGTRVKIVNCPYGDFEGREGVVTSDEYMVTSKDGLPEHKIEDGEFHLHFFEDHIEPIAETRDPELTSPYGDGNHPLPVFETPETGTLAELQVQPGDVVEACWHGDGDWEEYKYVLKHPNYGHECLLSTRDDIGYIKIEDADQWKFRIISRASDTPKTWGEMSDAEKGELLLAAHEGKVIECCQWPDYGWDEVEQPQFDDTSAYRIKPQPKRETVTLYVKDDNYSPGFRAIGWVETEDGKLGLGSIKMEALG